MTALKTIVAVMTVMLVAGFGVLVGGLVMQAKRVETRYGEAELRLPAGAKVVETTANGDRLVLRVALPGGDEQLDVLDVGTGRLIGTIAIKHAP